MKITSTKGNAEVSTIEEATRWLEEMQPSHASIDGYEIESPEGEWTAESANEAIAAAMADGDWYWIDGSAYCPACVQCDTPAIDAADATRGPCESGWCACCRRADDELLDVLEESGYFKPQNEYCIAFVCADGSWDRFQVFVAENDDAANAYAEKHYDGKDWYVLDARGRNINGGDQE